MKKTIVSVSGGKDSTALYCLAVEFMGNDFIPVFADTGNEHPVTVNYVRNLHVMAGGPEVVIVKADFKQKLKEKRQRILAKAREAQTVEEYNHYLWRARLYRHTGTPFLDLCLWKGRVPSTKAQFCTEWIKLWPIAKYLEEVYPFEEYEMLLGLRAGESERRSKRHPFEYNSYFDCDAVNPMLYETEQGIFDYLESKGVPPNPLYAIGFKRVGCFPCIHASKTEIQLLPDWAWDKLQYWEERIGRSWFPPGEIPTVKGYPTLQQVREWSKTSFGGKQYDLFKQDNTKDAPSCMSTWGHCE